MSGIGGYMARGKRRYVPPPDDDVWRCHRCHARLDVVRTPWSQPHLCKRLTYGTVPLLPLPVIPVRASGRDSLGGFLANLLGADDAADGPPYTHTLVPPEPVGYDEHGRPVYDPDGLVTHTFTERGPDL